MSDSVVGRYCEYTESINASRIRERCDSLDDYLAAVTSGGEQCDAGIPGVLTWTPDDNTPDIVYYQVATYEITSFGQIKGLLTRYLEPMQVAKCWLMLKNRTHTRCN